MNVHAVLPRDEVGMIRFHESLSERSVYFRYFQLIQFRTRTEHGRLSRICARDAACHVAVVRLSLEESSEDLAVNRRRRGVFRDVIKWLKRSTPTSPSQ